MIARFFIPAYILFVILCAGAWPLIVSQGFLTFARFGVCVFFLAGPVLSLIGFLRYLPQGHRILALSVILIGQSLAFALLGAGFLRPDVLW